MGSFNVVCSLTGKAILSNEKCHLIVFNDDFTILNAARPEIHHIEYVIYGEYDDYGFLKPSEQYSDEFFQKVTDIVKGPLHFYISEVAWDWCQKRFEEYIPNELSTHYYEDLLKEAIEEKSDFIDYLRRELDRKKEKRDKFLPLSRVLLAFQHSNKNVLSGYGVRYQYWSGEEVAIELAQFSIDCIRNQQKEFEEDY